MSLNQSLTESLTHLLILIDTLTPRGPSAPPLIHGKPVLQLGKIFCITEMWKESAEEEETGKKLWHKTLCCEFKQSNSPGAEQTTQVLVYELPFGR